MEVHLFHQFNLQKMIHKSTRPLTHDIDTLKVQSAISKMVRNGPRMIQSDPRITTPETPPPLPTA